MNKAKYVLTIDHSYQNGFPMNASKFMAGVEMVRRLLEERVPCKQIGACAIAFPPEKKDRVFSAIDTMSETLSYHNLKVSFAKIEFLDEEFKSWCHQDPEAALRIYRQDENAIEGQDIFDMSLEKG
jgi:hypothetical protein